MQLYRFSPIETPSQLEIAIKYTATQASKLYFNVVGDIPKIESLTVFSHYADEYKTLTAMLLSMGKLYNENNGPRVRLTQPLRITSGNIEINGVSKTTEQTIQFLRIRQPDPYRMQVGCCDFEVNDYETFKDFNAFQATSDSNPRCIKRDSGDMLEFYDPDIDVLGYVVSAE